jgi:hypothetical protein
MISTLLQFLMLVTISAAALAPNHSRAAKLFFDIQLIATGAIIACYRLVGFGPLYTDVYDCLSITAFIASAGVVWEARKQYR